MPTRSAINEVLNKKLKVDGVEKFPDFHEIHFELTENFQEFCLFDSGGSDPSKNASPRRRRYGYSSIYFSGHLDRRWNV